MHKAVYIWDMANFCYVFEKVSISTMYYFTITPVIISCFEQLLNSIGLALISDVFYFDQTLTHY